MMPNLSFPLLRLLVGGVRPLGRRAAPSGIAKTPVTAPVLLRRNGLQDDAQGDTVRHGGPEKAVHHYPFDHYARGNLKSTLMLFSINPEPSGRMSRPPD
jgi:MOSC domain-containing protein YiiM